jgi:hypothetical protein
MFLQAYRQAKNVQQKAAQAKTADRTGDVRDFVS